MLTISEVAEITGFPRSTLTSYRTRGYFPEPDEQYGRTPLWRRSTVDAWMKSRK